MGERPVLFNAEMVRAILDGRKTVTRRVVKLRPPYVIDERDDGRPWPYATTWSHGDEGEPWMPCPYGEPGDALWLREAWRSPADLDALPPRDVPAGRPRLYLADADRQEDVMGHRDLGWGRYRHARFMPRSLSRITLRVTDVRIERVQDISDADACAEGVLLGSPSPDGRTYYDAVTAFAYLWEGINTKRGFGWEANPHVWVVCFEVAHG